MTNRRYIRTWIGNDRGENGKTRVTFLWEPLPPTAGREARRSAPVTVMATSASGETIYRGAGAAPAGGRHRRGGTPRLRSTRRPAQLDVRLTIEGDGQRHARRSRDRGAGP